VWTAAGVVAAGLLLLAGVMMMQDANHPTPPETSTEDTSSPFAPDSPFRTPVTDTATVATNSAAIIRRVAADGLHSNLVEFGIPIYEADATTPHHRVRCTVTDWGPCPFDKYDVPIPDDARPHIGSDGAMVVIDRSSGQVFEFWQASRKDDRWTASFGAVTDLAGSGWVNSDRSEGHATGSGASRLAGVVRLSEIENRDIPHALALQSKFACAKVFVAPAIKTDGKYREADCVPEGALIRLDPALDLNALALTPAVRTVARAMQAYGAYVIDTSSAPLGVSFELDPTATRDFIGGIYEQAGLRWDADDSLRGVPLDRLQVIDQSAGR
jgi:hypothetical protein